MKVQQCLVAFVINIINSTEAAEHCVLDNSVCCKMLQNQNLSSSDVMLLNLLSTCTHLMILAEGKQKAKIISYISMFYLMLSYTVFIWVERISITGFIWSYNSLLISIILCCECSSLEHYLLAFWCNYFWKKRLLTIFIYENKWEKNIRTHFANI